MSGFERIGDDAPACVDGVCELPSQTATVARDGVVPVDPQAPWTLSDKPNTDPRAGEDHNA